LRTEVARLTLLTRALADVCIEKRRADEVASETADRTARRGKSRPQRGLDVTKAWTNCFRRSERPMNPEHFKYSEQGGVARIQLDRPERLNRADLRVLRGVARRVRCAPAARQCAQRDDHRLRARLLLGRRRQGHHRTPVRRAEAELFAFTRMTCDLIENMRKLEKPIVAALNGTTCGAGAVIAAARTCASRRTRAKIAFLFTKVGLSGADMGAAWLLPRIVGLGRASELLMLGEFISAQRAYEIGLYNEVCAGSELEARALDWAQKLANGPSMGLGGHQAHAQRGSFDDAGRGDADRRLDPGRVHEASRLPRGLSRRAREARADFRGVSKARR
jgi:enoyl-CoA hydratase/carnithine racemase